MKQWMLDARQARVWVLALIVEVFLVVALVHSGGLFLHVGMDFLTTYTAADMILDGEASALYDTRSQWERQLPIIERYGVDWPDRVMHPYIAPPILALVAFPLVPLGAAAATGVWALVNALAAATAIWLLARHVGIDWRLSAALIVGSLPLFSVLMLGQVEGLLLLAFVLFVIELRAGREARAGLALAFLAIKPPLLVAPVLYLLVTGRRRATVATIGAGLAQALLSALVIGPGGVRDYIDLSRRMAGPDGAIVTNVWGMVNIRAAVVRIAPVDDGMIVNTIVVLLTAAVLTIACMLWRRSGRDAVSMTSLGLLAMTTVLTSYHALYHTALLALLGVVLLLAEIERRGDIDLAGRLFAGAWVLFTAAPLASFAIVASSKAPATISTIGVVAGWGIACLILAQSQAAPGLASPPSPLDVEPVRVSPVQFTGRRDRR